jgi:hypothetical protein
MQHFAGRDRPQPTHNCRSDSRKFNNCFRGATARRIVGLRVHLPVAVDEIRTHRTLRYQQESFIQGRDVLKNQPVLVERKKDRLLTNSGTGPPIWN